MDKDLSSYNYLYRIQPSRPAMLTEGATSQEAQLVDAHFQYLQRLTQAGVVLLAGRTSTTNTGSFGIIVFSAADDTAARAIMENDPAVKEGVFKAELYPFRVALMHTL